MTDIIEIYIKIIKKYIRNKIAILLFSNVDKFGMIFVD